MQNLSYMGKLYFHYLNKSLKSVALIFLCKATSTDYSLFLY